VVVPHPAGRLVVGHDRASVALPDTAATRQLLSRLGSGGVRPPHAGDPPEAWRLWRRLLEADLLVTEVILRRSREAVGRPSAGTGPGIAAADAAVLAYGEEARGVLRARASAVTAIHGPEDLRAPAIRCLEAAGVPVARGRGRAVIHVVTGDVTPDARTLADLLRRGSPHLAIVRDSSAVTVGPFVVPGHTACSGCLEATRADRDPDQGMVRLLRARRLRERTMPGDAALLALALAVATRDLVVWAAGDEPSTWSATRTFTHAGAEERADLRRHPRCGCAWDALGADAG